MSEQLELFIGHPPGDEPGKTKIAEDVYKRQHSPVRVIMKQTFITGKFVPHGDGRASDTLILWTMKDSNG